MNLVEELKKIIKGDVLSDEGTLADYSHDASLFELKPQVVVCPKDIDDLKSLVKFVTEHKKEMPDLSLTGRSGGTDMGGGSLGDSIIVSFGKYFNHLGQVRGDEISTEPGVYYRDFEKETLKAGLIMPSYPASREICAMGGIVNNNSGGEKSLNYGKTEKYVKSLKVVLSDGNECILEAQDAEGLKNKIALETLEGEIYRKMYDLISQNYDLLQAAKPKVSKNSAGYYLWNVWDKEKKVFDLTKLFTGAQGTLGLLAAATLKLVPAEKYSALTIAFLNDTSLIPEIVNTVLPHRPESFEGYDDNTLRLAIKFFPSFAKLMGARNIISLSWQFLPEFWMFIKGGIPKLILQIEFAGNDQAEVRRQAEAIAKELEAKFKLAAKVAESDKEIRKYWLIRRESFNLLRHKIKDKHTAPFIDDIIVPPARLGEFLPELNKILADYPRLIYTIAGHIGDGNFHIIPLMNLENPKDREIIGLLGPRVYELVLKYGGSITAEHNDGLVRSPYLREMYGDKVYALFEETKRIFDPQDIFNPRKKVGGNFEFSAAHIRKNF
ncbi:MAG TPA: FAD-binding oxidoreductase [Candidatus Tyrphobacter sp.]|nr:FAD-binding oxidoreductase [Candidatus Tyrphobacter sp.]